MIKTAAAALGLLASVAVAEAQAPAAPAAPSPGAAPVEASPPDLPPAADCTFTKVFACEAEKGCAPSAELGTIDLPARFLVHYGKQIIASVSDSGLPHITEIHSAASQGDNVTLQGTEGLLGWVMQLSRTEPEVTLTTVTHDKVLTAFGTCKPAP